MGNSINVFVVTLRWIQWVLGAYSFGVCLTYFLINVYYWLWTPFMSKAQLALAGTLHIYLYLAAIWISVKPQAPLVWAILDIAFLLITIAAAGSGQASISEYCLSSLTLYWSDSQIGYVPLDQLSQKDLAAGSLEFAEILYPSYLQRACGLYASVIAVNGVIVFLFILTAAVQIKQHLAEYRKYKQCRTESETA